MRKTLTLVLCAVIFFSCANKEQQEAPVVNNTQDVKEMNFDELFKSIKPEELTENVFKLVGQDYTVITAGNKTHYNSMTASWGGLGILFNKPASWCFLRANRYTLELINKEERYTLAYFEEEHKEQVLFFGSKTGRDTDKMKETTLTMVETPDGNIAYKEAKLIIECKLIQQTTVSPDDFLIEEGKTFVTDAHAEAKDYHKILFGEITNVWVRK